MSFVAWNSQPLEAWAERYAKGTTIDLDGHRTHYLEFGHGSPVILLHGFFYDSYFWDSNAASLAARWKVYAVDLWGFGYSSRAPMAYGYELYAKQVLLFMDALQLPRTALIGQSLGAGIAMMIAAQHPTRVSKLVLAAPAGLPNPLPFSAQLFCLPLVGEWLAGLPTNRVRRWLYQRYLFHDGIAVTEAHFDEATRFQKIRGTTEASLSILRRRFFDSLSGLMPQLAQRRIPTLIVWGREDRSIPVDRGVKLRALLPHARLEIVEGAGHAVNVEAAEPFNRLLTAFLCDDTRNLDTPGFHRQLAA